MAQPRIQVPEGLYERVMARIALAERRAARLRFLGFAGIAALAGAALIPALRYAGGELYASGFGSYASLIFSDTRAVLGLWNEVGLSLLESLPSFALLALAGAAVVLGWSAVRAARCARGAFPSFAF